MIKKRKKISKLSKLEQQFLNKKESFKLEFKESVSRLQSSDLVAFANSRTGGTILIGVEEIKNGKGKVIGCSVSNRSRIKITEKAEKCIPPVNIEIFIENYKNEHFFRIEIPSSKEKPHCTQGGTYLIRGDGRNNALEPNRLLGMFLEKTEEDFLNKYRAATKELEDSLSITRDKIIIETNKLLHYIQQIRSDLEINLKEILDIAEATGQFSEDAMYFSDEALGTVKEIDNKVENLEIEVRNVNVKVDELIKHFNIEDPLVKRLRQTVKLVVKKTLEIEDYKIRKNKVLKTLQEVFPSVEKKQLEIWYKEQIKEIKNKKK